MTPLQEFLQGISLAQFINKFLYIWYDATFRYEPWTLWEKQHKLCDYIDNSKKLFLPKARQVGGSSIAADKAIKCCLEAPNQEVIIISKNEDEAKYFLSKRIAPVLNNMPKIDGLNWGEWEIMTQLVKFDNGSFISCLPTSEGAGSGHTARLILLDEARFIEHARQIWGSTMPAVEKNPNGQIIILSNSGPGTWFNAQLQRIVNGEMRGVDVHFLSVWVDPARNQTWYDDTRTTFDSEIDFYMEYPETVEQMLLQREGFVFPNYDDKEGGDHVIKFEPNWNDNYIYGYDDGYVHWAAFLLMLYDPYEDMLYVLDEMYDTQKDTSEISKQINSKVYHWREEGAPKKPWRAIADTAIFANKGQKTVADLIRVYTGINFQKSWKHDEAGSLSMLQIRFTQNRIAIHPRCQNLRKQLRELTFDKNGKPRDAENDGIDILRYVCAELSQQVRPVPEGDPKPYDRNFSLYLKQNHLLGTAVQQKSKNTVNSWQAG